MSSPPRPTGRAGLRYWPLNGIRMPAKPSCRYRPAGAITLRKTPDLLRRNFTLLAAPNVAWAGNLTESRPTRANCTYKSIVDLHSRPVPGVAMDIHHDAALARAALCMAIAVRGGSVAGVIFYTGQGGEYTGEVSRAVFVFLGWRSVLSHALERKINVSGSLRLVEVVDQRSRYPPSPVNPVAGQEVARGCTYHLDCRAHRVVSPSLVPNDRRYQRNPLAPRWRG